MTLAINILSQPSGVSLWTLDSQWHINRDQVFNPKQRAVRDGKTFSGDLVTRDSRCAKLKHRNMNKEGNVTLKKNTMIH